MGFVISAVGVIGLILFFVISSVKKEQEKVAAMSPSDRAAYLFGKLNEHLVCPHCQTKGLVRAKQATKIVTSTGKVGGILKTNTTSKTTAVVTQHHCDQCGTTWDV